MIAALFVQKGGVYYGLEDVDPWDEERDARKYAGPWPVVAHPPCARWCRLAGLVQARWGHMKGDDDGCFESALSSVRRWGGVLEHPAHSAAWATYDLPVPSRYGGWQRGMCGGWSCQVEQWKYGHKAKKATWLYCHGIRFPPSLRWGFRNDSKGGAPVSWCGNHTDLGYERERLSSKEASASPIAFRDELIGIARTVESMGHAERDRTPPAFRDALIEIAKGRP